MYVILYIDNSCVELLINVYICGYNGGRSIFISDKDSGSFKEIRTYNNPSKNYHLYEITIEI